MNIAYHAAIGATGFILFPEDKLLFFLASIAPDFALIPNEIRLRIRNEKFNEWKVPRFEVCLYHLTHSLFVTALLYFINPVCFLGHFIHIVCDWFTHTGRFSARPFFPVSRCQVTFGRNILK